MTNRLAKKSATVLFVESEVDRTCMYLSRGFHTHPGIITHSHSLDRLNSIKSRGFVPMPTSISDEPPT